MAETAIGLQSSHRVEDDGTHTVLIQISGIPSLSWAQGLSDWMRKLIRENAHEIGRLDANPPRPS